MQLAIEYVVLDERQMKAINIIAAILLVWFMLRDSYLNSEIINHWSNENGHLMWLSAFLVDVGGYAG